MRANSSSTVGFGVALACALAGALTLHAQNPQPRLFLSLADSSGTPITDLKGAEVILRQGASTCVWVRLDPVNWPTKLTVIVDNGVSMGDQILELRSSLRAFLAEIPSGIEVSLITTAPQPRWLVRPTTNREALMKGVELLGPDRGLPKFVDALMEAAERIDKDKPETFSMLVAIATDTFEGSGAKEQDLMRMFDRISSHPVTAHVVLLSAGSETASNSDSGTAAIRVATLLTKTTGGEYDAINSASRLVSLMPDVGRRVALGYARESHQYKVSCDRWDGPVAADKPFSLGTTRRGVKGVSSADGHVP